MFELQNALASAKGASSYFDEMIVKRDYYGGVSLRWHFARHYFNSQGMEIAYFIPDLLPFHEIGHLQTLNTPRVWPTIPLLTRLEEI